MRRSIDRAPRLIAALSLLALAGCGGGGGGGGSGSSSSSGGGGGGVGTLTLGISPANVQFASSAPNFGYPESQRLIGNVTGSGTGTLYIVIASSNPAVANVANVTLSGGGGTADIIAGNAQTLGLGTHTATITVRACINSANCSSNEIAGSPQTVNVNYFVTGVQPSTTALNYTIGNSYIASDLTRTFTVGAYPINGWTASTDVPLLGISPITGGTTLTTSMTTSLDDSLFDEYEGGIYSGAVRVLPNMLSPTATTIPVTVDIQRTRVNFVSPYVAEAGRADDVIIRGEYFNLAPPTGVRFGGIDAVSYTVVSNTEIRARHPALAAGAYPVHVVNAQGIDRSTAELHVVASTAAYPAAVIQYPDGPEVIPFNLIYDAQRRAMFVNIVYNQQGAETNQLVRYEYSNGAWRYTGRIPVPYRSAFALTADGRRLLFAHAPSTPGGTVLEELDPVSLATVASVQSATFDREAHTMAVANDGRVLIQGESSTSSGAFPEVLYSPGRHNIVHLQGPLPSNPRFSMDSGHTAGSGDGSLVLVSQYQYGRAARYVSGTLATEFAPPDFYFNFLRINRRGTLMLADNIEAYDGSFARFGRTPNTTRASAVAPTLPRIYTVDMDDTIRTFDASQSAVGGNLVELPPAITPVASPGALYGTTSMTVSHDGHTLFLATREHLLVQPLP
jgi:hypothetical protein